MYKHTKWADAQPMLQSGVTYLIFWAEWCSDCCNMLPLIQNVINQFADHPKFKAIFVHPQEAELMRKTDGIYNVLKIPAHLIVKDGQVVFRELETVDHAQLVQAIEDALN